MRCGESYLSKGLNVLSLFDGMSCGMLAFLKLGIKPSNYYAYEIDKYAIKTTKHNFPNIKQCGDVFEADFTQYKNIDYLIGGSPCTYWSIAQKNNRETEASGMGWELFSQYVRALKEARPKFFIYENNKSMSKAIYKSISDTFGFEPICINSALVSAQNRQRLYWVGIRNNDGVYQSANVLQPDDKGVLLKDILDGVADREKSRAIIGSVGRTTTREYFLKHQGQMAFEPIRIPQYGVPDKARPINALYPNNCGGFEQRVWSNNSNKQQVDLIVQPIRVGSLPRPNGQLSTSQAFRIYNIDGKSVNITANGGGAGGKTGLYAIPVDNVKQKYIVYTVINNQIEIKGKQYPIKLPDGYYIIRKLTITECKRLQTVPEWYEFPVSDTQAYRMLGNGWTVDVIAHILKGLTTNE